jgi:CelD/BcsL family acetyltransferase involved in cellulose biosynthesis
MRTTVIPAAELSPDLMEQWLVALHNNPLLQTPLLRPELFQVIGRYSPRTFVAIIEEPGCSPVFLPFHRTLRRLDSFAGPVPICDYQAFVTSGENQVSVRDVLRAVGLKTWIFDNLLAPDQVASQINALVTHSARRTHLWDGFARYSEELQRTHPSVKKHVRSRRVLVRDYGDLRFVMRCHDAAVLKFIFAWKSQRYNGGQEVSRWIVEAVEALRTIRAEHFSGELSAMYAGNRLVAAHFGIRSGRTLFSWFSGFDAEFARYSPGFHLHMLILQHMEKIGSDVLDLGPGGEKWKMIFANAEVKVGRGFVELPSILNFGRATWRSMHGNLRKSQVARSLVRPVMRMLRSRINGPLSQ